eukprot:g4871.t1
MRGDLLDAMEGGAVAMMDTPARATMAGRERTAREECSGWQRDVLKLVAAGALSLLCLGNLLAFYALGNLPEADWQHMHWPTSLANVQQLGAALTRYRDSGGGYVRLLVGHAATYLFLQTFSIPGTLFTNLLGGALFGMRVGFPACVVMSGVGSCCCYKTYGALGRRPLLRLAPGKLQQFRAVVEAQRRSGELTRQLTMGFVFPFAPHWLMKSAAPHMGIPLGVFMPAVTLGLAPYNFLTCKAGLVLSELTSKDDIWDSGTTVWLAVASVLGVVGPRLAKHFRRGGGRGSGGGGGGGLDGGLPWSVPPSKLSASHFD